MVFPTNRMGKYQISISGFGHGNLGPYYKPQPPLIFSGLGGAINNFASSMVSCSILSLFQTTLSGIFFNTASYRSTPYLSGGAGATGGTGGTSTTTSARKAEDIAKDLRKYARLSGYCATDAANLKAKASAEKTAKEKTLNAAKAAQLTENDKALTYKYIKNKFKYDSDTTNKQILDAVFSGKSDESPVTAEELQKAITTIKNTPSYSNAISPDWFISQIGGNASQAIDNLKVAQEQFDNASAAAAEAESVADLGDVATKTESLKNEYAAAKSGYTKEQIDSLKTENQKLQEQLNKLAGRGKGSGSKKYDNIKSKIDANNSKIGEFNKYYAEAEGIVSSSRSPETSPNIPANPQTTTPTDSTTPDQVQKKTETDDVDVKKGTADSSGGARGTGGASGTGTKCKVNSDGKLLHNGDAVEITKDALKAVGLEPDNHGVYEIEGKFYKIKSNKLVECQKNGNDIYEIPEGSRSAAVGLANSVVSEVNSSFWSHNNNKDLANALGQVNDDMAFDFFNALWKKAVNDGISNRPIYVMLNNLNKADQEKFVNAIDKLVNQAHKMGISKSETATLRDAINEMRAKTNNNERPDDRTRININDAVWKLLQKMNRVVRREK